MMSRMKWARAKLLIVLGVGLLAAPVWGANAGRPGTVNYVEGDVMLNGAPLNETSIGVAELKAGQTLETRQGKAEMLMTPGVFLRLGDNSELQLTTAGLTDTQVTLVHGKAMVEATQIFKGTDLAVSVADSTATLEKKGLYEFNADRPDLRVYDGQAIVMANDRHVKVKKGHETELTGVLHARKFDRDQQDGLYAWSNVRSQTLAEASASYARTYADGGGYGFTGWYGAGWYWNPWYSMYSFVPGDGIFYSPFGWPFYSPGYIWYAPLYFSGGYWHGGTHWAHPYPRAFRGSNGFHSFHGLRGGGGFHGNGLRGNGGFRGGFHGGGPHGGGHRGR